MADAPAGDLNHDGAVISSLTSVAAAYSPVQYAKFKQPEVWPTIAGAPIYGPAGDLDGAAMAGGGWAASPDEAHFYAPCSGAGTCSRATGLCACFDGYEGAACQRGEKLRASYSFQLLHPRPSQHQGHPTTTTSPPPTTPPATTFIVACSAGCSGRGQCKTVGEIASAGVHRFVGGSSGVNHYTGMLARAKYRLWDADTSTKCVCDAGYTGAACEERACPLGDDPLTNEGAVDEVQGFTLSGATNDGASYALRFTNFDGSEWTTAAFRLATDTTSSAAMSANAASIKAALEGLPGGVAGAVTAACGTDYGSIPNVRCTVAFTSLPGNVPDLLVLPMAGAAPVVAQPSQPVHVFVGVVGANAGGVGIALRLFPDDADAAGFRATQFVGTTTAASATDTSVALAAAISEALQGTTGASAFTYRYGASGATVDAGAYGAAGANVVVIMPSRELGAGKAMRLIVGGASYDSVLDAVDGTKETLPCSNRGTCDTAAGACSCFSGFTGIACERQNVLAV